MPSLFRTEYDSLGEQAIDSTAYYGAQTSRALKNFPFSHRPVAHCREFVVAFALVKKAAALANGDLGLLPAPLMQAIVSACDDLVAGRFHDQFVVDVLQGGAGTSTNMNANEVIANRALELLGEARGAYHVVHPNNHVNLSQSTNDTYPSAVKVALRRLLPGLTEAIALLAEACRHKSEAFRDIIKMGRTQLQDAVPTTLGRTFAAYRATLLEERDRIAEVDQRLLELNLGGTAIGTGLNTSPPYRASVIRHLAEITGEPYRSAPDLVAATQDTGVFLHLSGVLKHIATKLSKLSSDLRLLSSGPRAGLNEINLPALQAGSSIMPGKVNPVIPEAINQIAFLIAGNDVAVTMAASAGQLELNAFEPLIAAKLFESIDLLTRACHVFADKCIVGITPNADVCRQHVAASTGLVTALGPSLGYERCTQIAREALETGASIRDVVLEKGWLARDKLDAALDPRRMLEPNLPS